MDILSMMINIDEWYLLFIFVYLFIYVLYVLKSMFVFFSVNLSLSE